MDGPGREGQRYRLHTLSAIFTGVGLVLLGRSVNLQVVNHEAYAALARESHLQTTSLPARRGAILDAKRNALAITVRFDSLYVVGTEVREADSLAMKLAPLLEMSPAEVRDRIDQTSNRPVLLKARLPSALALQIEALRDEAKIKGIFLKQESFREYPEGSIASQVLGFVGREHMGLTGF
jgi:cell division protein FtsI/penicillin-binding protein 2